MPIFKTEFIEAKFICIINREKKGIETEINGIFL